MPEALATPPAPAAPPSTPAPTPAPAAAPAAPEPGFLEDPELSAQFDNPFDKIDQKLKPQPKVDEKPPEKVEEKKKPDALPEKPKVEKKDDKKETPAPAKDKPVPKELKEHNLTLLNELKEERRKVADLEKRFADAEAKGKDTSKLSEQLAAREKEIAEIKGQLSAARFTESDTFKKSYQAPLDRMIKQVHGDILQLQVITGKDEAGEPKMRQATWNDFLDLYQLPYAVAAVKAKQMFGEAGDVVKDYLRDVRNLDDRRQVALSEEKENWQKNATEKETKAIREKEMVSQIRSVVRKDIADKNPNWFGEDPDDPDGNVLLKEGYDLADSYFNGESLSPQDRVVFEENIRHRLAGFSREVHRNAKLTARVAELEEKLNGKRDSQPGSVRREGSESDVKPEVGVLEDPELNADLFRG